MVDRHILGRVARLEARRKSDSGSRAYLVEWLAGETPDHAIARAAPTRPFILAPAQCATMDEWSRDVMEVLAT